MTKLNIEVDKSDLGYGASIGFMVKGVERASLSFGQKDARSAIMSALESILYIAPSLTQEELDAKYDSYPQDSIVL